MRVRARVVSKIISRLPQPLNGKMMIYRDFPLERPKIHQIILETGQHKTVSPEEYERIQVGDTETVYVSEPPNWKYIILSTLVFILVVVVIVYS